MNSFAMYQQEILDHAKNPRNHGEMEDATETINRDNPLCGDSITLFLKISDGGTIEKISFTGEGCTISLAATSLFTEHATGKKLTEIESMTKEDMMQLLGAQVTPAREKCATLPLDAVLKR